MPLKHLRRTVLNAIAASVCLTASPGHAQDVPKEILAAGKADFMTYCAVCHGKDGAGNGPVAKHLTTDPADLTKLAGGTIENFPDQRVHMAIDGRQEIMGHGTRDMPIWGNWFKFVARSAEPEGTDNETTEIIVILRIQGVIDYLKTIQSK